MRNYIFKSVMVIMAMSMVVGCKTVQNANKKQKGAVIGATGGAVIGGLIGTKVGKGKPALGAIIGDVVGGAAGGYIGDRMDRQAERIEEEIPGAEVQRVGEGINETSEGKAANRRVELAIVASDELKQEAFDLTKN